MDDQSGKRKKLVVIVAVVLVVLALILGLNHGSNTTNNPVAAPGNESGNNTTFEDTSLLDRGVTSDQLSNFEQALEQYLSSQNEYPNQVSFTSIQRVVDKKTGEPTSTLTFTVQLDGKNTYQAKLDGLSLVAIRLYLYDLSGGKLLYDSQDVGGSPQQ